MKNRLLILSVIIIVSLIISCSNELLIPETGSLVVHLADRSTRAIPVYTPTLSMENVTFSIYGTGPNGARIEALSITESSKEFNELQTGVWEITIDGYNVDGKKISRSTSQTIIRKNQVTTETVQLSPLLGLGNINFSLDWEDPLEFFSDSRVLLSFQHANNLDATTMEGITIVDTTHASEVIQLESGWYLVTAALYEGVNTEVGNLPWWQTIFSLRIVEQETTTVNFSVLFEDITLQGTGASSLYIQEDMKQEFSVSYSGTMDNYVEGDTITLTTATSHSNNALYRWYVNGVLQLGVDSRTMNYQFLTQGRYHISLFVIDNGVISGYQEVFVVSPPVDVEQLSIDQGESITGATGTRIQLSASIAPSHATNQNIRWESSNLSIAEVDQNGMVSLKAEGEVVITASAEGGLGVFDSCAIWSEYLNIGASGQGGGKIFYVDRLNEYPDWTYLEFAQHAYYPELPWGHYDYYITGTYTPVGWGPYNTTRIIDHFGRYFSNFMGYNNYAAKYCDEFSRNGYDDWFLPSRDELLLLAEHSYNIGLWNLGNGGGTPVWTSVADGSDNALMVYLTSGSEYSWGRWNTCLVIPIRRY